MLLLNLEQLKQQNDSTDGSHHHQQEPLTLKKITHQFHRLKQQKIYAFADTCQNSAHILIVIDYQRITLLNFKFQFK